MTQTPWGRALNRLCLALQITARSLDQRLTGDVEIQRAIMERRYPPLLPYVLMARENEAKRAVWVQTHQDRIKLTWPAPAERALDARWYEAHRRVRGTLNRTTSRSETLYRSVDSKIRRRKYPPLLKRQA